MSDAPPVRGAGGLGAGQFRDVLVEQGEYPVAGSSSAVFCGYLIQPFLQAHYIAIQEMSNRLRHVGVRVPQQMLAGGLFLGWVCNNESCGGRT